MAALPDNLQPGSRVTVTGVLDHDGANAARGTEKPDRLRLVMLAWRFDGGEIRRGSLRIEFDEAVESVARRAVGKVLAPYAVCSFQIQVPVRSVATEPYVISWHRIVSEPEACSDLELLGLSKRIAAATTYIDPSLGRFNYEPKYQWFESEMGSPTAVGVTVDCETPDQPEEAFRSLHAIVKQFAELDRVARERLCCDAMELKNKHWLEEDEAPLASEAFNARLALNGIHVHEGAAFEFIYDADGMFTEHFVKVRFKSSGEVEDWDLH
jgi:hypothetical protein